MTTLATGAQDRLHIAGEVNLGLLAKERNTAQAEDKQPVRTHDMRLPRRRRLDGTGYSLTDKGSEAMRERGSELEADLVREKLRFTAANVSAAHHGQVGRLKVYKRPRGDGGSAFDQRPCATHIDDSDTLPPGVASFVLPRHSKAEVAVAKTRVIPVIRLPGCARGRRRSRAL